MSCGRHWKITFTVTVVCGILLFLTPVSRMTPAAEIDDVVNKTTTMTTLLRGQRDDDDIPSIVTQNVTSNNKKDASRVQEKPNEDDGGHMSVSTPTTNTREANDRPTNATTDQVDAAYDNFMKDCTTGACMAHVERHRERWGGDLLNMADVHRLVVQARQRMIERFKNDYGEENFVKIFKKDGKSRGRTAFVSANALEDDVSIERFKRKLKMKILSMQAAIQAEREPLKEVSRRRTLLATKDDELPTVDHYERLVWATGGHSAAAGHGNLFNESYTAFMSKAISNVFGAIAIDFEGRNHAMGGTASGPEISLCSEQIFGSDADIISWDYGMTDGNWYFRQAMYEQRMALHPNRPANVGLNVGGTSYPYRVRIQKKVEELGLTAIYLVPEEFDDMEEQIPDTFGLSREQLDTMPRMIQHYKCQGAVEKGEPTCSERRYTNLDICPERDGMVSWHPGWKRMALIGNIIALFLSDMLVDSIAELGFASDRPKLLALLQNEEDTDYRGFAETSATSVDRIEYQPYELVPLDNDLLTSTNVSVFFRKPSICHTATLPAQTRYLGILTESEQTGVFDYFKGISIKDAKNISSGTTTMPLVYDDTDRVSCEAELKRDQKDFFLASNKMGPTSLTIPNQAERQAYGRESEKLVGILVICTVPCPWGRCLEGELELDAVRNGTVSLYVNDQPVTNVTDFAGCSVLRGDDGHRWQPNEADQYVVRASFSGNSSTLAFLRISSLIVL